MKYECSYCGATEEYIENGECSECGSGSEWIFAISEGLGDENYCFGGDLVFNNVDNVLEDKRSGRYRCKD